jgi:molybdopterin synthase sulfur carrier subunit
MTGRQTTGVQKGNQSASNRIKLMKILYFAWLKEHTGQASEEMQLPNGVDTVGGLIPHITQQSAGHKTALKNLDAVRVAVNRVHGDLATPITNTDEVAFFPPVTGG